MSMLDQIMEMGIDFTTLSQVPLIRENRFVWLCAFAKADLTRETVQGDSPDGAVSKAFEIWKSLQKKDAIFFWGHLALDKYGIFSNFYECNTVIDVVLWKTIEHFFQAQKVLDPKDQEYIRIATTPKAAKDLGRHCVLRKDWEQVKFDVMLKGLRAKFSKPEFRKILMQTGDKSLYEGSPYDSEWGTGEYNGIGTGKNLLGKALMQVREDIHHRDKSVTF